MRLIFKTTIGVLLIAIVTTFLVLNASEKQKEVLIKFSTQAQTSQIDSLTEALGLTKIKSLKEINVDVFKVSSDYSVNEVVRICSRLPFVEYAEPTAEYRAFAIEAESSPGSAEAPAAAQTQESAQVAEYKPGEVIVKFKTTVAATSVTQLLSNFGLTIEKQFDDIGALQCRIGVPKEVLKVVEECNADPNIEYAEPNYIYHTFVIPNDPRFSSLFGMDKIDAPEAWDIQTGSKAVIVGVIDTGVDREHKDLEANMWINQGEFGNGKENNNVDDDGNGFVDDFRGWDFINDDNNPFDDNQHGTHVSGTIGAVGNNGEGVVGVCLLYTSDAADEN